MRTRRLLSALVLLLGLTVSAAAQFQAQKKGTGPISRNGPKGASQKLDLSPFSAGEAVVQRWRVGMIVTGGSGPCRGIVATTSVPTDWPKQQVRVVAEDLSPGVRVAYRMVDGAVKEMTARIPALGAGEQASAVVTFEVKRNGQRPPDDTGVYVLPNVRKSDDKLRPYLDPSPYIESTSPRVKALADEIGVDKQKAWDRVEAIHDWIRENIELVDNRGRGVKTTLETLQDGTGDCDEFTSLFVAICRAGGIPARTVRVPGHCYGEFYLEDDQAQGHWFACDATRAEPFGELSDPRPVLQKGDNLLLRDPATKRMKRYPFLPDNLTVADHRGTPPQVRIVLELVAE
ncbi:MAG: transglutaminase domain-containing protein [Planctomycetota bacterium]